MRKEYDFSKARKNPYASQLKKQITIRLDEDSITYFKAVSEDVGIPSHQSLSARLCRFASQTQPKLEIVATHHSAGANPAVNADAHRRAFALAAVAGYLTR